MDNIRSVLNQTIKAADDIGDAEFYFPTQFDSRGRRYLDAWPLNPQANKAVRGLIDAAGTDAPCESVVVDALAAEIGQRMTPDQARAVMADPFSPASRDIYFAERAEPGDPWTQDEPNWVALRLIMTLASY